MICSKPETIAKRPIDVKPLQRVEMTTTEKNDEKIVLIRIRCDDKVFYAALTDLREEVGGLYQGFESWHRDQYAPVTSSALLTVQKDLRLCVRFDAEDTQFCDLSMDNLNSDPFQLIEKIQSSPEHYIEYQPTHERWQKIMADDQTLKALYAAYEEALF